MSKKRDIFDMGIVFFGIPFFTANLAGIWLSAAYDYDFSWMINGLFWFYFIICLFMWCEFAKSNEVDTK